MIISSKQIWFGKHHHGLAKTKVPAEPNESRPQRRVVSYRVRATGRYGHAQSHAPGLPPQGPPEPHGRYPGHTAIPDAMLRVSTRRQGRFRATYQFRIAGMQPLPRTEQVASCNGRVSPTAQPEAIELPGPVRT
ncbi:hypothetical protein FZEAL_10972 [Fusarium zealandicum]|uniref:Uncharacterized protein n=1 Tax=Fusarium zealandicum TaxID=1053134 RepID=A0A8H4TS16_9HYPO|nr:hypothetical protein FZEAL_10972 [Fusarium zealandicum]